MTKPHRQRYGLGSFIKKTAKKLKKVVKSPIGKAALIGGLGWAANAGMLPGGVGKNWWSKGLGFLRGAPAVAGYPSQARAATPGLWGRLKDFGLGKAALIGGGILGTTLPFMGTDEDDEVEEGDWTIQSPNLANLLTRTKDYYRNYNPSLSNLSFQPAKEFVDPSFYAAKEGGIVGLANGGQPAEAQAEQMLRMEYQKYRNQGGTMSYQQFKMAVLQQAQSQGPMAQGQPQMAAYGGRAGYQGGELVEDESMIAETPAGMMQENVEEVQGEPTREQLEALAMEIFQLPLEQLDEEQLMVVYQAAMEQQPEAMAMQEDIEFNPQMAQPQMAAEGGRMGYLFGKKVGAAYADPNRVAPKGDLATNMLNVFASKFGGRKIATPGNRVAQSNSFMGSLVPQAFQSQDADYQAYLASGSELPYQAWKASRATAAEGGRIGKDEGGLMSLGGMEKDYRQEGGFVPLGKKEKADDVPARLSKNEFVFTADAVRAAGGGDIDAGAEVMENMMNNLESGGEISEESQGAQGMYDQQQMLQSRMA
jgi:hypothetical protein